MSTSTKFISKRDFLSSIADKRRDVMKTLRRYVDIIALEKQVKIQSQSDTRTAGIGTNIRNFFFAIYYVSIQISRYYIPLWYVFRMLNPRCDMPNGMNAICGSFLALWDYASMSVQKFFKFGSCTAQYDALSKKLFNDPVFHTEIRMHVFVFFAFVVLTFLQNTTIGSTSEISDALIKNSIAKANSGLIDLYFPLKCTIRESMLLRSIAYGLDRFVLNAFITLVFTIYSFGFIGGNILYLPFKIILSLSFVVLEIVFQINSSSQEAMEALTVSFTGKAIKTDLLTVVLSTSRGLLFYVRFFTNFVSIPSIDALAEEVNNNIKTVLDNVSNTKVSVEKKQELDFINKIKNALYQANPAIINDLKSTISRLDTDSLHKIAIPLIEDSHKAKSLAMRFLENIINGKRRGAYFIQSNGMASNLDTDAQVLMREGIDIYSRQQNMLEKFVLNATTQVQSTNVANIISEKLTGTVEDLKNIYNICVQLGLAKSVTATILFGPTSYINMARDDVDKRETLLTCNAAERENFFHHVEQINISNNISWPQALKECCFSGKDSFIRDKPLIEYKSSDVKAHYVHVPFIASIGKNNDWRASFLMSYILLNIIKIPFHIMQNNYAVLLMSFFADSSHVYIGLRESVIMTIIFANTFMSLVIGYCLLTFMILYTMVISSYLLNVYKNRIKLKYWTVGIYE